MVGDTSLPDSVRDPRRSPIARVAMLLALFALLGAGFMAHAYRGVTLRCSHPEACHIDDDYVVWHRSRSVALENVERLAVAPQVSSSPRAVSRLSRRYRLILETSDEDIAVSRRHIASDVEPWLARFEAFQRGETQDIVVDLDARPDAFGIARWAAGLVAMCVAMLVVARMRARQMARRSAR